MNVDRILRLADAIEAAAALPEGSGCGRPVAGPHRATPSFFSMRTTLTRYDCGTAGCVAGFAQAMFGGSAQATLGLDRAAAHELFMPRGYWREELQATRFHPRAAARVLRRLAATGRVEWGA